jgi:hypothetical protein
MNDLAKLFLLAVAAAILAAMVLAVWLIGEGTLRNLAYIFVGGLVLAAIIASSALPIRAHRKRDMTGETRILDGTRTIVRETKVLDGRAPAQTDVKLLQLPQQPQGGAWPELLRASWQAGLLANPRQGAGNGASSANGQDLAEFDFRGGGDSWDGDITP